MQCRKASVSIAVALLLFLSGCGSKRAEPKATDSTSPTRIEDALFVETTVLLDGGAYATSGNNLWYLKGGEAIRVVDSANAATPLPQFDEITPTLNGSTYGTTFSRGLWHLEGDKATKVKEVESLSGKRAVELDASAMATLYLHERKLRRGAEDRLVDSSTDQDEPAPDDYRPY